MSIRRLWLAFGTVVAMSFAVLGWTGIRIYQQAPPVPLRVAVSDGRELIGAGGIHLGQNVWQSMGGMEVGSVWGHGSYVAPDWTADWLHREAVFILDAWREVLFASVVIAFLFFRLKLVGTRTAAEASILSATIFLSGGIIGTGCAPVG